MDNVYLKIGEIIKIVQYIEYNLAELIEYKQILNLFESKSTVSNEVFERTEKKAKKLREKLSTSTLGNVIGFVKKYNIFSLNELKNLEDILGKRNDLVHQYFKRKDFEKQSDNVRFIQIEANYLKNFLRKADSFNDNLCELLEEYEAEYDMIEDS